MGIYQAPCQYPPLDTVCTRYQFSMSDLDHLVPNFPLTEGDVRLLAPACVSCLMTQAPSSWVSSFQTLPEKYLPISKCSGYDH